MTLQYDFIVIGSGLAGLTYALKVADHGSVCIISKEKIDNTNTHLAQGGIAAVMNNPEDKERHISDTIIAGAHMSKLDVVKSVVEEAEDRINEMIKWGTLFDKKKNGSFDLAKEGGHSDHRILHYKDSTGAEIQRALTDQVVNHKNIDVFENHFALDIITQHHLGEKVTKKHPNVECYGLYCLDIATEEISTILAKQTCIATGGIGNIYQTTTNPAIATGDGIAMVYRAKGKIENMEFVQFHPTAMFSPQEKPSFLITEALRGHGAILRNTKGVAFMDSYDERGSLAPRDIVARAIDNEMKINGTDYVYLDCTHLEQEELKQKFPNIYDKCLQKGIHLSKDYIPVTPAAHYLCGGISVDLNACTSIKNLYAVGEVSCTGLHGANRLASNSLLEAAVFAHRAANHAIKTIGEARFMTGIPDWNDEGTSLAEEMVLITQNWKEMQQFMSYYVGIVRSDLRLERALKRLEIIYKETEELYEMTTVSRELCELRNAINVAYLIIKMAEERKESVGLHYTINYPPVKKAKSLNKTIS